MSAPDKLLPCPFCGATPILHSPADSGHQPVECKTARCPMSRCWPDVKDWNRRYIRAPDSAPNGLADSILCLEAMNADNLAGYDYGVNEGMVAIEQTLDEVEAGKSLSGISQSRWQKIRERLYALRNQPGGAVPRGEPVAWRWWESKWNEYRYCEDQNPYRDCEPLYTKAGEGKA